MSEMLQFLEDYARSYETFDPARVAAFINIPCIFCLGRDLVLLETQEGAVEFMRKGLQAYQANGCKHFKARLHGERQLSPNFAVIDVEWMPEDDDGERRMHFSTTYNLVRSGNGWKVVLITRHDPDILTGPDPR